MPSLYEINQQIACILDSTTDDGELLPEAEVRLDQLAMEQPVKIDNICKFVTQCGADETALMEESKRLAQRAAQIARRRDRMKDYLKYCMEASGITKLSTERFSVWIQNNAAPSVVLAEGAEVPSKYQRIRVELDARQVAQDFKAGLTLPPSLTVSQGKHLRIK